MTMAFYHLLGHVYVATHPSSEDALRKLGMPQNDMDAGRALVHETEAHLHHLLREVVEERILEHSIHIAAEEVAMWVQTGAARLRRAALEPGLVREAVGKALHPHNHTLAVVAQALRLIATVRARQDVQQALGGEAPAHDFVTRGYTLLAKLFRASDTLLDPHRTRAHADAPVFEALHDQHTALSAWFGRLMDVGAQGGAAKLEQMGTAGFVPNGLGLPMGGAALDVVLHERATSAPPDPHDVTATSGWSLGRQGRNKENLGEGWMVANHTFSEVAAADADE